MSWQIDLKTAQRLDLIDDINQSLHIILNTQKGEDILRPEFGCDLLEHLDKPIDEAKIAIAIEIIEAIEIYEPRVKLLQVVVELNESTVFISLNWTIKGDKENNNTQLIYGKI